MIFREDAHSLFVISPQFIVSIRVKINQYTSLRVKTILFSFNLYIVYSFLIRFRLFFFRLLLNVHIIYLQLNKNDYTTREIVLCILVQRPIWTHVEHKLRFLSYQPSRVIFIISNLKL